MTGRADSGSPSSPAPPRGSARRSPRASSPTASAPSSQTSTTSSTNERRRPLIPSGERVLAVHLDVRELESIEACLAVAVERWGGVDVWVNNAARTVARPFLEIDQTEWDDVLATNLRGTYFGCRVAGRHMCERGHGRIVNLASVAGQWGRSLTGVHYAASKAGIVAVTRVAAATFAPHGVTVNAIAPAAIEGPRVAAMPAGRRSRLTRSRSRSAAWVGPRRSLPSLPTSRPRRPRSLPARPSTSTAAS